jgi:hypothetical protein
VSLDLRNVACSQAFLGDDRDLGEKLRKRVEDEIFRGVIRVCHGGLIRFVTGIRVRTVNLQDCGAGTLSDWDDQLG